MRTVYWQNGEQVSRAVLTLCSRGPPGSWHATVSTRAILVYFQVAPSNHEDYSLGQLPKIAAHAKGVLSLASHRRIGAYREAAYEI